MNFKPKKYIIALTLLGWLLSVSPVKAETITEIFDISLTGFGAFSTRPLPPAPIDTMNLSFTLTYDPTQFASTPPYATTSGITLNNVNIPYSLPLSFAYGSGGRGAFGKLDVGTYLIDSTGFSINSGFDLALWLNTADYTSPKSFNYSLDYARYFDAASGAFYYYGMGNTGFSSSISNPSSTITVSAVPLPPAIWLFGSALAGLIGFNRRKSVEKLVSDTA